MRVCLVLTQNMSLTQNTSNELLKEEDMDMCFKNAFRKIVEMSLTWLPFVPDLQPKS